MLFHATIILFGLLLSLPALADLTGRASVIDGNTIEIHGQRIRLFGIDAPESQQLCQAGGESYRCGQQAALALSAHIAARPATCARRDIDRRKLSDQGQHQQLGRAHLSRAGEPQVEDAFTEHSPSTKFHHLQPRPGCATHAREGKAGATQAVHKNIETCLVGCVQRPTASHHDSKNSTHFEPGL
jgi:hypothetical protein